MRTRKSPIFITAASAALLISNAADAADTDGIWNTILTPSSWDLDTNWTSNIIADGAGFTADFSQQDIAADTTVNLNVDRTIGNLIFGDPTASSAGSWILATGTPGGKLTLSGTAPTITVNALGTGKNTQITATLDGTAGFTKAGAGTLVLNNNTNSISGAVVVSAGTLSVQSKPLTNVSSVALNNGGTMVVATTTGNAIGPNNNDVTISFNGGTLQYNVSAPTTDYSARFSGDPGQEYRINMNGSNTVTFSSNLASAGGSLTKLGTGSLVLAAANGFSGATTVSGGTLDLSNPLALQNSPINTAASIAGTATAGLVLTGVTSPTFGGLTGGKALASLFDTDSGNYGSVTNVTLNPGSGADHTYTAVIANGTAGMTLTKSGLGKQTLNAANTYSGGTILNGGTLNFSNASALSSGPITYTGGTILQAGVATTLANPISVAASITGTVGTAGFATTLSGPITGVGTLAKGGGGVLTLTGGETNTIAGGFRVASGRLVVADGKSLTNTGSVTVLSGGSLDYSKNFASGNNLTNALTLSGTGDGTLGALNLRGNATATGAITLDADATISHNFDNATISGAITGSNRNLSLSTLTTMVAQPGMTISGPVSLGTGGITVQGVANSGLFSVKLSGSNSYTGETRVVSGTLMLGGDARIDDAATVRIDSTTSPAAAAVLHLDFAGTDTVGALYLGGTKMADGTYGAIGSDADNESGFFAGTGILDVKTPANNYVAWANSQTPPVTGGEDGDDDNDGVENLIEYALADGGERGVFSGGVLTFTKRGAPYGGDLTYIIETSETLSDPWTPVVTHGPAELGSPIGYDLAPAPGTQKKFARLKVVKNP